MRKTIAAIVTLGTVSSMLAGTVYAATNTTNATSTGNTANTTANATSNTTSSAPTNSNMLTQKSAVYQLIEVFNTIPSWPKGLQGIDPQNQSTEWNWYDKPIPESEWTGLACVFPGDPESKYAADLGIQMTNPNGPVTAGQIAQWIVNWEEKARQVNLQYEPSQNPFTLLQDFSFFYGTDVKGPNSVLTQKDMMAIRNNIVEVSRGWRQLGPNRIEILAPLIEAQSAAVSGTFFYLAKHNEDWKAADWPSVYAGLVRTIDSETLTFQPNGEVVYTYKRGTGFTPNITGVFVRGDEIGYSFYSFSDEITLEAYKKDIPSLNSRIFYEPDYQTFSPKNHLVNYSYNDPGYVAPKNGELAFELWGGVTDPYNAKYGGELFSELKYEFIYQSGHLQAVHQIGQSGENYPSEVIAYGD